MTLAVRPILAVLSLSALFLTAGCGKFFVDENGGGSSTTSCTNCVYVANSNSVTATSADIAAFAVVNPLAVASSTNVALGDAPLAMAVDPKAGYLFASASTNSGIATGNLSVLAIASNGTLGTSTSAIATLSGLEVTALTVDPTGVYVIGAEAVISSTCTTGYVSALQTFTIGSGGTLTQITQNPVTGNCGIPTSVAISPDGTKVFVGLGQGGLEGFTMTSSIPTFRSGFNVQPGSATSVNGVAVDSGSKYLFLSATGALGGVAEFTINAASLTAAGTTQNNGTAFYPIVVSSSNTYIYAADQNSGKVYGYTFGSTGLTAIAGSPFSPSSSSSGTIGMATDNTGKYVLTINALTGPNLQEYTIGTGGALAASSTGSTGTASGSVPAAIAITGSGT